MNPAEVTLRPVQPADEEFLLRVYASTRSAELALVPWTPEQKTVFVRMQFEAQRKHYQARYPRSEYSVIAHQGRDVGRLWRVSEPDGIHILDLTLLPECRGAGIGAALLRRLQREAAGSGLGLFIYVESAGPALPVFEHLGFRREKEEGIQWLLHWMP